MLLHSLLLSHDHCHTLSPGISCGPGVPFVKSISRPMKLCHNLGSRGHGHYYGNHACAF